MDVAVLRSDDNIGWFKRQMDSGVTCFAAMQPAEQASAVRIFHRTEHALMACVQCTAPTQLTTSHDQCCKLSPGYHMVQRLSSLEKQSHLLKENLWRHWHSERTEDKEEKSEVKDIVQNVVEQMASKIDFFEEVHLTQESLNRYNQINANVAKTRSSKTQKKVGRPKKKRRDEQRVAKSKKRKNPHPKKVTANVIGSQEYDMSPPVRKSRRRAAIKSNMKLELGVNEGKSSKEKGKDKDNGGSKKKKSVPLVQVEDFDCFDGRAHKSAEKVEESMDDESEDVYSNAKSETSLEQSSLFDFLSTTHFNGAQENITDIKLDADTAKPYDCSQCSARYSKLSNLKRHISSKHSGDVSVKTVVCERCPDETFKSDLALWLHFNEKHAQANGVTACMMCGEKFGDEEMKIHIKTHFPDANYACKDCAMMFVLKEDYDNHQEDHRKDVFRCIPCKAKFGSALVLSKHCHSSTHQHRSGQLPLEKKHLCAQCGRSYFRKHALLRHMRYHTGEKPFKCPHCDYWCREDTNLKLHVALHFSRRDFVCDACGAAFHQKKTLERHVLYKHSDARDFVCPHCAMAFKTRYALARHEQVHSARRPYACAACAASFKRQYNLRHHMRTVHGGNDTAAVAAGEAGAAADSLLPPPRHVKVIDAPEGEAMKGNRGKGGGGGARRKADTVEAFGGQSGDRTAQVTQIPGTQIPGTQIPGTQIPDTQIPGTQIPGTQIPGTQIPGTQIPGTQIPGTQIPGTQIPDAAEEWQKVAAENGSLQVFLATSMGPEAGSYTTTPLLPQPTSTLSHDLLARMVLPVPSAVQEPHGLEQQPEQQQQQQQQYLTVTDTTQPAAPQPMLVDKQYQDTNYPYYFLPSVNPQQS